MGRQARRVFSSVSLFHIAGLSLVRPTIRRLRLSVGTCGWRCCNANILTRTELFKKESLFGRVRDPASSQGAARGSRASWPLCSHYVYTDYMTLTQRCTRTATAPVSCVLTGRFFHTHPNYRVEQRGLARAGTRCQAIRSSAGVAPPPGGTAPRTHAALAGRWAAKTARAAARAASATTTAGAMAGG